MSAPVDAVPAIECPGCGARVPAGAFCGDCGCDLAGRPGARPQWLRARTFAAAPRESVLRPAVASSLFPHLPDRSRTPFRVMLAAAAVGLLASAVLRLPSTGIAIAALSLPLLFAFYLHSGGLDRDIPRSTLTLTATLGAALGTGWVLVCGHLIARTYEVPMAVGLALHHLLAEGIAIPLAGMVLMTVPALVIRLSRGGSRESLEGFAIGASGALAFTAAATMTRLAPQVTTGLIAHARPVQGLLVEVVMCGVTMPITAAAAGGMVGIALWFRNGDRRVRLVLAALATAALLGHAAVGVVDMVGLPQLLMLATHLTAAVLSLLVLRLAVQLSLLHEVHDPGHPDQPVLCVHCGDAVPEMAFCPACGSAAAASSRFVRSLLHGPLRPQRADTADVRPAEREYPGYALPPGPYLAGAIRRPRLRWLLGRWGTGVATAAFSLAAVALLLTPDIPHYMCPPDCGKPPSGTPVMALPRFASPVFSVSYPAPGSAYTVSMKPNGVTAAYTAGDGGVMQLFSEPAAGRSARQIARAIVKKTYPDAKFAYQIPNAMVGYQPGYGEVADDWPQSSTAGYSRLRILVMTAVKNDLALVAFATGPYHAFGPDFGPGPPSGANLEIALDMGKYVNSFQWNGDPAR